MKTFKSSFAYILALGFIALGIYIATNHSGIYKWIGIGNIVFFSALIIYGITKSINKNTQR